VAPDVASGRDELAPKLTALSMVFESDDTVKAGPENAVTAVVGASPAG
jgi:hypothetical protein